MTLTLLVLQLLKSIAPPSRSSFVRLRRRVLHLKFFRLEASPVSDGQLNLQCATSPNSEIPEFYRLLCPIGPVIKMN